MRGNCEGLLSHHEPHSCSDMIPKSSQYYSSSLLDQKEDSLYMNSQSQYFDVKAGRGTDPKQEYDI